MTGERGTAGYFDGVRPIRREVAVSVHDRGIDIHAPTGELVDAWPADLVRLLEVRAGASRFVLEVNGEVQPTRLEVWEPRLLSAIAASAPNLQLRQRMPARTMARIGGLATLALASVTLFFVYGIPALADRLGPLVPADVEMRLGRAVEGQVQLMLNPRGGDFVCRNPEGVRVLQRLTDRLTQDANYAVRPRVAVGVSRVPNAFALPGGQIYMLRGLMERARTPDEFAAVLAHELGHVYHRHAMRRVLQAGATSFFVGLIVGDFAGAGAVSVVVQNLSTASYSRDAEREADSFAVDRMVALGADPRGLGTLLTRITREMGQADAARSVLSSHPWTPDRVSAIEAQLAGREPRRPILDEREWAALRGICG